MEPDLARIIRTECLTLDLPPSDIPAEEEILSAVLSGELRVPELEPEDFYDPFHADVLRAVRTRQTIELVPLAEGMHTAGTPTWPSITERLLRLRDGVVFLNASEYPARVRQIQEMARRRQLVGLMVRLRHLLCGGAITATEADTQLRNLTGRWARAHSAQPARRCDG